MDKKDWKSNIWYSEPSNYLGLDKIAKAEKKKADKAAKKATRVAKKSAKKK